MKKPTIADAKEQLHNRAKRVKEEDIKKVIDKQEEIKQKFEGNGPLKKYIADVKILFSLVKDYWNGVYREIPYWTIAAAVAALLYVLSPIDLIPDIVPVIGYIDDAMVVALCLNMIESDLHNYRDWKVKNA